MRILGIGGGPGGLYFALLAKLADPTRQVEVHERNGPDDTFGFGVVFSDRTLSSFREHDAETYEAIAGALVRWDTIDVRHRGRSLRSSGHGFAAIARKRLLQILQERARAVGVALHFHSEVDATAEGYDLVVAADGANSQTRTADPEHFGPSIERGAAKYIWFGTDTVYDSFFFAFQRNSHGAFASHAYPYAPDRSTFIVETDEASWRRAGLDVVADTAAAPGASDLRSRDYLSAVFADHLRGGELLVNNSKWLNFPTVRARRWTRGAVVLLGDAAHTAHFSVGSGTKMAMEDAAGLAAAVQANADGRGTVDVPAALAAYEAARRVEVERIQHAARPSLAWWEHYGAYMGYEPEQFAMHFLTRNPRITLGNLRRRDGELVAATQRWFAQRHDVAEAAPAPSRVPLHLRGLELRDRVVVVLDGEPGTAVDGAAREAALVLIGPVGALDHDGVEDLRRWLSAGPGQAVGVRVSCPAGSTDGVAAAAGRLAAAGAGLVLLETPVHGDLAALVEAVRPAVDLPLAVRLEVLGAGREEADVEELVRRLAEAGCDLVAVADMRPRDQHDGWPVLELCSRLRLATGVAVLPLAPLGGDEGDTMVLSGRADLFVAGAEADLAPEAEPLVA